MAFDFEAHVRSLSQEERDELGRQMWDDDDEDGQQERTSVMNVTSEQIEQTRREMRKEYNDLTEPAERLEYLQGAALALGVKPSQFLLWLKDTNPVNIGKPPAD